MLRQHGNADFSWNMENVTQKETSASYPVVSAQLNQQTVETFSIENLDIKENYEQEYPTVENVFSMKMGLPKQLLAQIQNPNVWHQVLKDYIEKL